MQFLLCRTKVHISLRILVEGSLPKEARSLVEIRKRDICSNSLLFQGLNILRAAVDSIAGKLARLPFPAKTSPPQQIQCGLIFHDLRGSDQRGQDDAGCGSVRTQTTSWQRSRTFGMLTP